MNLVNNWLKWLESNGLTQAEGLRHLNRTLRTKYKANSLSLWKRGVLNPHKETCDLMREIVAPMVFMDHGVEVPDKTAENIARGLS